MVDINLTITTRSPLHVGAGAPRGTLAKRGLRKDRDGWPFIPASALKGRWRHAVEQVAAALPGLRACTTHQEMCRRAPCAVCQIFGAPWRAGRLRFTDLTLSGPPQIAALRDDDDYYPRTTQRSGVALNRRRRVAEDQHLYDTELFLPGAPLEFSGDLRGPLTQAQAGLLLAGLRLIPALGGGKTGGLGWIEAAATVTADGEAWTRAALATALEEVVDA
jgi:CRISPR/Cas system CSM-associated protein Csm3 (group 7 of RAMP superfamily)